MNKEKTRSVVGKLARVTLLAGLVASCGPTAESDGLLTPLPLVTATRSRETLRSGEFRLMSGVALKTRNSQDGRMVELVNRGPLGLEVRDLDNGVDYSTPLDNYAGCSDCQIKFNEGVVVPDWAESFRITSMEKGKNRMVRVLVLWPWTREQ